MEYSRVLTYLIHRNNIRFDECKFRRRHGVKVEFIDKGRQSQSGADEGGIVSDHATGKGGDGGAGVDSPVVDIFGRRSVLDEGEETTHCWGILLLFLKGWVLFFSFLFLEMLREIW